MELNASCERRTAKDRADVGPCLLYFDSLSLQALNGGLVRLKLVLDQVTTS